jgi:L-malate glycosyltransferase
MTEPTTVLMVVYSLYPAGAERMVLSLTRTMDRSRFRPVVCALKPGRLSLEFERAGVPVHLIGKGRGSDIRALARVTDVVRRERPFVVHSHNFSANLWGRLAALVCGVPVVIATEHSVASIKTRRQRLVDRCLARISSRIVCVSESVRESLIECVGIPPYRTTVIHNGVEVYVPPEDATARSEALRASVGVPPGAPLVVTVGRLEPPKGHDTLLRTIPLVAERVPDARFALVGDGSLRTVLEHQADLLGIRERCIFLGHREDVRETMVAANLIVSPSRREGFSLTVLEAMSVRRPIVATDVGGNTEAIVGGECGLIVPPENVAGLADAIVRMLLDPVTADRFAAHAATRFGEMFTLDAMTRKTETLYEECGRDRSSRTLD